MDTEAILLMEKNSQTGFLEREIGSYSIKYDMNYISKAFVMEENEKKIVFLYLTAPGDFEDWEYNALLDNYNNEVFAGKVMSLEEDEDSYNPCWIAKFEFIGNDGILEEKLNEILEIHIEELKNTLNIIKGLESEYK